MMAAGPIGWASVYSETFPSHDLARKAAERAAQEQAVAGETTGISYEDKPRPLARRSRARR